MNKHTPEPWMIHHDADAGEWPMIMSGGVVSGKIVANVNQRSFYCIDNSFVDMPFEANARRIVACVNACAGMSNDELEVGNLLGTMERRIAELELQRDELIIELQGLYRGYINTLEYGRDRIISLGGKCDQLEIMERDDPRLISARKIIAKTKGGAA